MIRVRDYDEALAVANDTPFGLSAGIVTTSLKHASHFKRHSESGLVMVNLPTAGLDYHVPFGGRKKSSYGPREQGSYAKEFYTIVKTAYTLAVDATAIADVPDSLQDLDGCHLRPAGRARCRPALRDAAAHGEATAGATFFWSQPAISRQPPR